MHDPAMPERVTVSSFRSDPLVTLTRLRHLDPVAVDVRLGRQRVLFVHHPDVIGEVLTGLHRQTVKENLIWGGRQRTAAPRPGLSRLHSLDPAANVGFRRLLQPAMSSGRICRYADVLQREIDRLLDRWQGEVKDVQAHMRLLATSVMGEIAFDYPFGERVAAVAGSVERLGDALGVPVSSPTRFVLDARGLVKSGRETSFLRRVMREALDAPREGDSDGVLELLERAGGDRDQAAADAFAVLLAGVDTTATMLTWLLYLLALHPEERERAAAGEGLQAIANETLRLYPASWYIGRRPIADVLCGGRAVPAHGLILLSPYATQRDERWFRRPEAFEPDRWQKPDWPRYAFFPFGGGERKCLGERLAQAELERMALAFSSRFRPEKPSPLVARGRASLAPSGRLDLKL
jgi:cytochrome P450